ncbi:MAG: DNA-3-methyladenine glycosylase family protein [Bacillus sp. (in: firmicutes)]
MDIFKYGEVERDYLKKQDPLLGAFIESFGMIEREVTPNLFTALVNSIISQQISTKAATTIRSRLLDRIPDIKPEAVASLSVEDIQACGMSMRKAGYIKSCADAVIQDHINLEELEHLPDDEVIKQLSSLHGVGVWTAEMLLIFSLQRSDVVSYGDLGIRKGMMKLYGLESLTKKQFASYRERYSPYGSVASLYLWEKSKRE